LTENVTRAGGNKIGELPERIIGAVFKTADGATTPPVRLNRTLAANALEI